MSKVFLGIRFIINTLYRKWYDTIDDNLLIIEQNLSIKKTNFFIDIDEKGAFIRLVHGTSSAHLSSILKFGLQPLSDVKFAVTDYLLSLNSGLDKSQIEWLLKPEYLSQKITGNTLLLSGRLEYDSHESKLFMLPLYKSEGYLKSAASNAMLDGGEIFRVARHVIEEYLGRTLQPGFPDAYPVVVIAKCYFEGGLGDGLRILGVKGVQPIIIGSSSGLFISGNCEMRLSCAIDPSNLEILPLQEYLKLNIDYVSSGAEEWRQKYLHNI